MVQWRSLLRACATSRQGRFGIRRCGQEALKIIMLTLRTIFGSYNLLGPITCAVAPLKDGIVILSLGVALAVNSQAQQGLCIVTDILMPFRRNTTHHRNVQRQLNCCVAQRY